MANRDMEIKLFQQMRLHPWIPEHKHWIDREIAMMRFEGHIEGADQYQKDYDAKLERFYTENPSERPEKPKKVGRPAKEETSEPEPISVPTES